MKKFVLIALLATMSSPVLADGFAGQVVSYTPGAAPSSRWYFDASFNFQGTDPLTDPSAALGAPSGVVTDPYVDDVIVSAFNPAANPDQIVSIGEGGSLILRMENYAMIGPGSDIGLFTNVGLADSAWPGGQAGDPASAFGADSIDLRVSPDGANWVSLGSVNPNIPTNAWTDSLDPYATSASGLTAADFSDPFGGTLADFDGLTYPQINTLLNGSAGGYWLDLSATGLDRVKYIEFVLPDDGQAGTDLNFELDAVAIASGHAGAPIPEPCTMGMLALLGAGVLGRRRK
jgi:hypothetical protein